MKIERGENQYMQPGTDAVARFVSERQKEIRSIYDFVGADAGARLIRAMQSLPSTGGAIDARGYEGAQAWSSNIFSGITKPVVIEMGSGVTTVSANVTVPANVTLRFGAGASLSIDNTRVVTIIGRVEAGPYQIFSGLGTVAFPATNSTTPSNQGEVLTEWWGAVRGDSAVDCAVPINKAIAATSFGIAIVGLPGWYYTQTTVSITREGVSFKCPSRLLCVLSPVGATIGADNTMFRIDVAASSTSLEIDGWRFNAAFIGGINYTGWWMRGATSGGGATGNVIDSRFSNLWFTLSTSSQGLYYGALVYTYVQNNVVELMNGGFRLTNASDAVSFIDNKSFSNYNELIWLDGSADGIVDITIDNIQVNGHTVTGNRAMLKCVGVKNLQISNINYENYQNCVELEQRAQIIYLSACHNAQISHFNLPDDLAGTGCGTGSPVAPPTDHHVLDAIYIAAGSTVKIQHGTIYQAQNAGIYISASTVEIVDVTIDGCFEYGVYITGAVEVTALLLRILNTVGDIGPGDAVYINTGTSGRIFLGSGTKIYRPVGRGIVGAGASTYHLTLQGIVLEDGSYNGTGWPGVAPYTSGQFFVTGSEFLRNGAPSTMGPVINATNVTGTGLIASNMFPGGAYAGNPKLFGAQPGLVVGVNLELFSLGIPTFTDGDTTPSVAGANVWKTANTIATTITHFDNGYPGQVITVLFNDAMTTLNDGGTLQLSGNYTSSTLDVMQFLFDGTNWYQVAPVSAN